MQWICDFKLQNSVACCGSASRETSQHMHDKMIEGKYHPDWYCFESGSNNTLVSNKTRFPETNMVTN